MKERIIVGGKLEWVSWGGKGIVRRDWFFKVVVVRKGFFVGCGLVRGSCKGLVLDINNNIYGIFIF